MLMFVLSSFSRRDKGDCPKFPAIYVQHQCLPRPLAEVAKLNASAIPMVWCMYTTVYNTVVNAATTLWYKLSLSAKCKFSVIYETKKTKPTQYAQQGAWASHVSRWTTRIVATEARGCRKTRANWNELNHSILQKCKCCWYAAKNQDMLLNIRSCCQLASDQEPPGW